MFNLFFLFKWFAIIAVSIYLGKKAYPYAYKAYSWIKEKFFKKD